MHSATILMPFQVRSSSKQGSQAFQHVPQHAESLLLGSQVPAAFAGFPSASLSQPVNVFDQVVRRRQVASCFASTQAVCCSDTASLESARRAHLFDEGSGSVQGRLRKVQVGMGETEVEQQGSSSRSAFSLDVLALRDHGETTTTAAATAASPFSKLVARTAVKDRLTCAHDSRLEAFDIVRRRIHKRKEKARSTESDIFDHFVEERFAKTDLGRQVALSSRFPAFESCRAPEQASKAAIFEQRIEREQRRESSAWSDDETASERFDVVYFFARRSDDQTVCDWTGYRKGESREFFASLGRTARRRRAAARVVVELKTSKAARSSMESKKTHESPGHLSRDGSLGIA